MAVAIDPFSYATAELSEEYISVFPNPDIVPKYLETVSDKTGVQLLTGYDSICIKGSWVAIKRVHVFLAKFLASYQIAQSDENQKLAEQEECEETEEFDDADILSPAQNVDTKFHDSIGEQSDWVKWTAKVLPQIHRIRSKRASVYSEPKSQTKKVPEPFVVYASFQPATDPAAKKPPTLDAIGKVLKKVYDKDKVDVVAVANDVANDIDIVSRSASNEVCDKRVQKHTEETPAESNALCASSASGQRQDKNVAQCSISEKDPAEEEHSAASSSDNIGSHVIATNPNVVAVEQPIPHTHSATKEPLPENTHVGEDVTPTVDVDSCAVSQSVKTDAKLQNNGKETETLQSSSKRTKGLSDSQDPEKVLDLAEQVIISGTEAKPERKTKRKGRPKKNEKYKKKKEDVQLEIPTSKSLTRAERANKRRNARAVAKVKIPEPILKKRGDGPVHLNAENTNEKKEDKHYVCNLCSYSANKLSHLREHKRRVHITKEFKCEKCEKVFGFGKDLKRHLLTHEKAENCCDICGKMYKGTRTLAEHKRTHETDYKKPEFPCDFCQKTFSTKYVLAYHVKSEHLGMKKTYLCPTCGKSFSQKNSYLQHANVHMGIKPYQCDICGRSFSYEKSLKEHRYMHEDNKQFECPQCHKKFRQSSGVAIHMKIHKERKDYVCSACGKGFSQKQALVRHERIHVGEKPFSCSLCQRKFTDSSILRRHMILIHKKDPKKWREDTENNVQRRTDFFINVLGEEGEEKKTNDDHSDMSDSEGVLAAVNADGDVGANDPADGETNQAANDSISFIPVGIGTGLTHHSAAMHHASISHDDKMSHITSVTDSISTLAMHNSHGDAVHKVDSSEADSDFAIAMSRHATPVNTPSPHHTQAELQAQASALLDSYAYADPNRLPSAVFYSGDVQQSLPLSHYASVLAQSGLGYHHSMVLMPDTVNFHPEHMSVTTASDVQQPADYENLVSQSHPTMQQHHLHSESDTQQ
ncbi:uncharacterized protein [Littorina saxatilis]|uniref:C2H2-type domain-containing protein n=1 Tax=Littorina saxatilis TaxID=31220 RepID=A0AAN9B2L5_9CAEN